MGDLRELYRERSTILRRRRLERSEPNDTKRLDVIERKIRACQEESIGAEREARETVLQRARTLVRRICALFP